ncbi:unnamed protein product, partial [marine sediment metagenome]
MRSEMPDLDYCSETALFAEGKQCPDLDDSISMAPKCRRYGTG